MDSFRDPRYSFTTCLVSSKMKTLIKDGPINGKTNLLTNQVDYTKNNMLVLNCEIQHIP